MLIISEQINKTKENFILLNGLSGTEKDFIDMLLQLTYDLWH